MVKRLFRALCYACGCEQTPTDIDAGRCTQCDVPVVDGGVNQIEYDLASLAVAQLRDGGMGDAEILKDYTGSRPGPDRVYEREYHKEHGVEIAASRVKLHMRRLLRH